MKLFDIEDYARHSRKTNFDNLCPEPGSCLSLLLSLHCTFPHLGPETSIIVSFNSPFLLFHILPSNLTLEAICPPF